MNVRDGSLYPVEYMWSVSRGSVIKLLYQRCENMTHYVPLPVARPYISARKELDCTEKSSEAVAGRETYLSVS